MIAYFALLSFVPLLFLSLALLSTAGQANEGSFFVRELHRTFPSTSLDSLLRAVRAIRENATALGIFGGAFLAWSSLSLFSVLESAFNIVYGRPNRAFLRGKALATLMMIGSLAFLFASLVVGSIGAEILKRYTGVGDSAVFAYAVSVAVSLVGVFVFLASSYVVLTNDDLTWREVLPGAAVAAIVLEGTFEAQPGPADAVRPSCAARVALRDGERHRSRRGGQLAPSLRSAASRACAARARWECVRFHSSPSSATVRSPPAGMKIGS
jgi:YihY family inner membrane protein